MLNPILGYARGAIDPHILATLTTSGGICNKLEKLVAR